jgi:hypothetical protein
MAADPSRIAQVFSIYSCVTWFQAGLVPRDFGPPGSAGPSSAGEWRR